MAACSVTCEILYRSASMAETAGKTSAQSRMSSGAEKVSGTFS